MTPPNFWESFTKKVTDIGEAVGNTAVTAGGAVAGTVTGAAGAVGNAAVVAGQTVVGTAGTVSGAVVEGTSVVAGAVGSAAITAGQVAVGAAVGVGGAISTAAVSATEGVGYALSFLSNNPQFQQVTKALPQVDFIVRIIDQVDIVKAETEVKKLQQQYPQEKPSEIAHRLMLDKALLAGTSGFASSIAPGAAVAFFVLDLTANMLLQAEMAYQIACAYGLDLKDPARKGEIVAIFGLSFGGGQALKAGSNYAVKAGFVGLLRNAPVAGAVIGASTNAAMIYALGYAACRFYEAKINPLNSQAALEASQVESDKYLEGAIAQEVVMDQILVHVVLAGYPGKTWEQILPELQTVNLSPASLEAIANNINSPPAIETLLEQINSDFAIPLLAQCQKIAQLDGIVTPEEQRVIEIITNKFKIDLAAIQKY